MRAAMGTHARYLVFPHDEARRRLRRGAWVPLALLQTPAARAGVLKGELLGGPLRNRIHALCGGPGMVRQPTNLFMQLTNFHHEHLVSMISDGAARCLCS
jgi:hypothetical protein